MPLGQSNTRHFYELGEEWLEISPEERLFLMVAAAQCESSVGPVSENSKPCPGEHKNQHKQPGKKWLSCSIQHWCGLTSVRPHSSAPQFEKDVSIYENVQRTAAKLVPGLEGMSYGKWLRTLGSLSLEKSRLGLTLLFTAF